MCRIVRNGGGGVMVTSNSSARSRVPGGNVDSAGGAGDGGRRQVEVKHAALAPAGDDVDLTAHRGGEAAADRQADARAGDAALGGVEPLERGE